MIDGLIRHLLCKVEHEYVQAVESNQTTSHMIHHTTKCFEPRSIRSLSGVMVRVSVVLKRTVDDSD